MRYKLHAVANAEDGNALVKQFFRYSRRLLLVDAGRTSGQDDAFRAIREDARERDRARKDLRIDLRFADPARDQLGILRAEVEDENSIVPEFHDWSERTLFANGPE